MRGARRGPTAGCYAWPIASGRFWIKWGVLSFGELPLFRRFLLGLAKLLVLDRL